MSKTWIFLVLLKRGPQSWSQRCTFHLILALEFSMRVIIQSSFGFPPIHSQGTYSFCISRSAIKRHYETRQVRASCHGPSKACCGFSSARQLSVFYSECLFSNTLPEHLTSFQHRITPEYAENVTSSPPSGLTGVSLLIWAANTLKNRDLALVIFVGHIFGSSFNRKSWNRCFIFL